MYRIRDFIILGSTAAFPKRTSSKNCSVPCRTKPSDDIVLFSSEYCTSVKAGSGTFKVPKGRSIKFCISLVSQRIVLKIAYSEITASSRPHSFSDIPRTSIYGRVAYPKDRFRVACSGQPSPV